MKILLDESVPQKLRLLIEGHTVVTAAFQGWSGLKNGALLDAAEEAASICLSPRTRRSDTSKTCRAGSWRCWR